MEQTELAQIKERIDREVRDSLPDAAIARVEVLEHNEDPEVEPGQLLARVVFDVQGDLEERARAMEAVHDEHRAAFMRLRKELDKYPVSVLLQFRAGGPAEPGVPGVPMFQLLGARSAGGGPGGPGCDPVTAALTPVMARLGVEDLETLDTLITAGIATSRADAVRWSLARIRERPAYAQLRARTREIQDLKSQF
jgi:hypothetical protein